jgi:AraC-like DNA-binding protein
MSPTPNRITSASVFEGRDDFPLAVQRYEDHNSGNLHTHEFHELVILQGGSGRHMTDHGSYPLQAGDLFLVRGAMAHGYADTRNVALINILFQPRRLGLPLQHLRDLPSYHALFRIEPKLRNSGRFRQRFRLTEKQLSETLRHVAAIELELEKRSPGYRFAACTHLMSLLGYLSRCYGSSRNPEQRTFMRLGEVLSYMENHLEEEITVPQLAAIAHMSESTLTRRFKKVLGRSPTAHLIRLRIDRARQLLGNPDMNITEISLACGFADSNYFSRRFRTAAGCSPRQYRNASRT